jgi:uncharacterized protein YmfQ (DUF2313 family)
MLFNRRALDEFTDSLARYVPGGPLFSAKNQENSNLRGLLKGLSGELFRANGYLKTYSEQLIPSQGDIFINEWERALGIPDACFSGTGSLDDRWIAVLAKLAGSGVQTAEDFEEFALIFGLVVDVQSGIESGLTFNTLKEARHTIVVSVALPDRFTYTFPIVFGNNLINLMQCVFARLRPAHCRVIFEEV